MISSRYAWAVAALLLAAFVPTFFNVYRKPAPLVEGALAKAIPEHVAGFDTAGPGRYKPDWVEENFAARDYVHRDYSGELNLFAARSWDGKKLFHFPELALTYGRPVTHERAGELVASDTTIPVRCLEFRGRDDFRYAAMALFYGKQPVRKPVSFLLSTLPELFVGRREPMTLLYVQGAGTDPEQVTRSVNALMTASAEAFLAEREPPARVARR